MNPDTQNKLNELNRRFYALLSAEFDASRDHPWPGWSRVHALIDPDAGAKPARILDVGCGNGRFGRFLIDAGMGPMRYVGVDQSPELLEISALKTAVRNIDTIEWRQGNILGGNANSALPTGPFDLIAVFGLLHHVPGSDQRRRLLIALKERLAKGGIMALTFWRFGETERFDRRIIPWREFNSGARDPIDLDELEEGDHLLSFGEKSGPPRYCHHCDETEISGLENELGLEILSRFESDGRGGDLNTYLVLRKND